MPVPKRLEQLNPPPDPPKNLKELYSNKIFIYLTDTQKQKYNNLKGDNTWSQIGRKALKVYFEGAHTLKLPNIEDYLREIVALVTHQQLPITQPRSKEDDAIWIKAKNQAIKRMEIQKPFHVDFGDCVNELKERFDDKENKGLETVPFSVQMQHRAGTDRGSYDDFVRKAELNKQGFENCKWKQKIKEVKV